MIESVGRWRMERDIITTMANATGKKGVVKIAARRARRTFTSCALAAAAATAMADTKKCTSLSVEFR